MEDWVMAAPLDPVANNCTLLCYFQIMDLTKSNFFLLFFVLLSSTFFSLPRLICFLIAPLASTISNLMIKKLDGSSSV